MARFQSETLYISTSVDEILKSRWNSAYLAVTDLLRFLARHRPGTLAHSLRVSRGVKGFLRWMGSGEDEASTVEVGGLLHDIGKLWIPESILGKAGPLSNDEWALVKQHPEFGGDFLKQLRLSGAVADCVVLHHERWDGTGYPRGLSEKQIPWEIRCLSVVDVYDALRSVRPYRPAMKHSDAIALIQAGKDTQFDPEVVELFLEWQEVILRRG